jgi:trehalose 6-phosphate phosphatase
MSAPPAPRLDRMALFADLDGTLAPIAPTPDAVGPDPRRRRLLADLRAALDGRLAVVSGRGLADLDRILEGEVAAIAAVHGLVRRTADGAVSTVDAGPAVQRAADACRAFVAGQPAGLLVEDKGVAVALHYRAAPAAGPASLAFARQLAEDLGLVVQAGDHVAELRPPGATKGDAVDAFMREPPFAGAVPVFIGDDLTDEAGFEAAARHGGFGVIVGPRRPTVARYALAGVTEALAWLASGLPASQEG